MLYIGVESTEGSALILELGGLLAAATQTDTVSSNGISATQIEFSDWSSGVPQSITNQSDPTGTVTGITAAYTLDGSTMTIEIAVPIYSNWQNDSTAVNLTSQMDLYVYSDVFSEDWLGGDHQCTNGEYIYSYSSNVMNIASLVRLVDSLPRTVDDIPELYTGYILNPYQDSMIDLLDFTVIADNWYLTGTE